MSDVSMGLPARQIAYFVADIRAAALAHRARFGSGPFVVVDHVRTRKVRYRGTPAALDHGAAYGQWGEVMVEFVCQHDAGPSAFHDLYPRGSGRFGLHHVAVFVEDLDDAIARFEEEGAACALHAETEVLTYAMVDTSAALGHMIELYEPRPALLDFYARIRAAARAHSIDGDEPWISS